MASIPCAAYKASSIHDNMRRQSRTRTTSTSSVDSECDSLSSSPSQTSLGGGMVMQMLRKTTGWASADAGRTKSQTDMSAPSISKSWLPAWIKVPNAPNASTQSSVSLASPASSQH